MAALVARAVFVTRGARGCLAHDAAGLHEIPGVQLSGAVDPVGAGDSMLAGIAAARPRGGARARQPNSATSPGALR
jgi:sugar/nucleoside kinase (ribokinase family)